MHVQIKCQITTALVNCTHIRKCDLFSLQKNSTQHEVVDGEHDSNNHN